MMTLKPTGNEARRNLIVTKGQKVRQPAGPGKQKPHYAEIAGRMRLPPGRKLKLNGAALWPVWKKQQNG